MPVASAELNYLAPSTPSSLYRTGKLLMQRDLGGSDSSLQGVELIITSIALVLGFLVVIFSELRSEAYRGILLSAAIVTALVADFLFMPALVLWLKPFGPEEVSADSVESIQVEEAA